MGKFLHWHVGGMVVALALGCTTAPGSALVAGSGSSSGGGASSAGPQTGGPRWSTLSTGLPAELVSLLMFNPNNGDELWAGSTGERLATLGQGASTWEVRRNSPLGGFQFLSVDPRNEDRMVVGNPTGIYLTSDGGETWERSATGLGAPTEPPRTLVRVPQQPDVLAAVTGLSLLFVSMDAGATWVQRVMPAGAAVLGVAALAGPTAALVIARVDGVLVSEDLGVTWTFQSPHFNCWTVVAHPTNPAVVLTEDQDGGLSISQDRGVTWTKHVFDLEPDHIPHAYMTAFSPAHPGRLVAAVWRDGVPSTFRVWISDDLGTHWLPLSLPVAPRTGVSALALHPTNPDRMAFGQVGSGVEVSNDAGRTWTNAFAGLLPETVGGFAEAPNGREIFVSTYWGLYRSHVNTLRQAVVPWGESGQPRGAFATTHGNSPGAMARTSMGVLSVREDAPDVWAPSPDPGPAATVLTMEAVTERIFMVASDTVYRSDNGGDTFEAFTPAPSPDVATGPAYVHPFTHVLYVQGQSGTWHASQDGEAPMMPVAFTGMPEGAFVVALAGALDSKRMYAGVSTLGVYRQDRTRDAWVPANAGLPPGRTCSALAVSPSDSRVVYAAINGNGVWKSVDAGEHWAPFNTGIEGDYVTSLQTSISEPRRIYAGTTKRGLAWVLDEDVSSAVPDAGVLGTSSSSDSAGDTSSHLPDAGAQETSSSSGGASSGSSGASSGTPPQEVMWEPIHNGLPVGDITALGVLAANPMVMLAATEMNGIFKTEDGGLHWNHFLSAAAGIQGLAYLVNVVVHPTNPDVFYVTSTNLSFMRTRDGGRTWRGVESQLPTPITRITLDPNQPDTLFGGCSWGGPIYRSRDGGSTWAVVLQQSDLSVTSLAVSPVDSSTVYAATFGQGLFISRDGGETWTHSQAQPAGWVDGVTPSPTNPDVVFWLPGGGSVARSNNAGADATIAHLEGAQDPLRLTYLAGSNPGALAAVDGAGRIYVAPDSAAVWTLIANTAMEAPVAITGTLLDDLGVAGASGFTRVHNGSVDVLNNGLEPRHLWAVTADSSPVPNILVSVPGSGLFRSQDEGSSWEKVSNASSVVDLVASRSGPPVIYAGGIWANQSQRSLTGGTTWEPLTGLPEVQLWHLALDPTAPNRVLAVTTNGVYVSDDRGLAWRAFQPTPDAYGPDYVVASASLPGRVVASGIGGVFATNDEGQHWVTLLTGYPEALHSQVVEAVDAPTRLLVASNSVVHVSWDSGATWAARGQDSVSDANRLWVSGDGNQVITASINGYGVYRSIDGGLTWSSAEAGLGNTNILAFATLPNAPDRPIVATGGGVFRLKRLP